MVVVKGLSSFQTASGEHFSVLGPIHPRGGGGGGTHNDKGSHPRLLQGKETVPMRQKEETCHWDHYV